MAKFTHCCLVLLDFPFAFFFLTNLEISFCKGKKQQKNKQKMFFQQNSDETFQIHEKFIIKRLIHNELEAQNMFLIKMLTSFCFMGIRRCYLLTMHFPLITSSKTSIHDLVLCHFRALSGAYNSKTRTISKDKTSSK